MNTIKKLNPDYSAISYEDIISSKVISDTMIMRDFENIKKLKADEIPNSFAGNKIIYHYMFKELVETKRDKVKLLKEVYDDPEQIKYWIDQTIKMDRRPKLDHIMPIDIFECYRRCKGSVNTFKAGITKHLITKYKGTKILDPTAGWGGRLLGARSMDCEYTGIDTNLNLKQGYDQLTAKFGGTMIFDDCLKVDFSQIKFDLVITSPPYFNLEQYNHMTPWENNKAYYTDFLIPLINKLIEHIEIGGSICINISDYMYADMIKYGGIEATEFFALKQQMGGKKNKEFIYVWTIDEE